MVFLHTGTLFSRESIEIIFAAQKKNGEFLSVIFKKKYGSCTYVYLILWSRVFETVCIKKGNDANFYEAYVFKLYERFFPQPL